MKYGSSPFYFECELIADFSSLKQELLGPQWEWPLISVGTGEWASSRNGTWGLQPVPGISIPLQQARVSLCSLWLDTRGVWTCHGQGSPRLPLPWESPGTPRFFLQLTSLGVSREWWGSHCLLHAEKNCSLPQKIKTSPLWMGISPLSLPETFMGWVRRSPTGNTIPCERQKLPAPMAGGQQVLEPFSILGTGYPQKSKSWSCSHS